MKIHKTLHKIQDISYDSIKSLCKKIDPIISENAGMTYDDFNLAYENDWDGGHLLVIKYYLPETEAEHLKREEQEEYNRKTREKFEREQLKALQKKYGTTE